MCAGPSQLPSQGDSRSGLYAGSSHGGTERVLSSDIGLRPRLPLQPRAWSSALCPPSLNESAVGGSGVNLSPLFLISHSIPVSPPTSYLIPAAVPLWGPSLSEESQTPHGKWGRLETVAHSKERNIMSSSPWCVHSSPFPFAYECRGIFLFLTAVRGALGESDYSLQGSQSPVSALLFSDIPTCLLWIPFCLQIYIF